jgi:hypothetical protein
MEWDNPFSTHSDWNPDWRYLPQLALGQHGEEIPVIWNKSIAFQKFQRYVHREMELSDYMDHIKRHIGGSFRALSLYGNDVEVFGYRPGRYHTEAKLEEGEWERIAVLFDALHRDDRFELILPSEVLTLLDEPGAGNPVHLESTRQPIPVKKQEKYNITRWAVTGRDDLGINTLCYRIYESLRNNPETDGSLWRRLCYLYGSDFRTHITEGRWSRYQEELVALAETLGISRETPEREAGFFPTSFSPNKGTPAVKGLESKGGILSIDTGSVYLRLNARRGLAITELRFPILGEKAVCGTLEHGYYDDIGWGADFYSGHLVFEIPGRPKVTDLNPVEPQIEDLEDRVLVTGIVMTDLGPVRKVIVVEKNSPKVGLFYTFDWEDLPLGSLRLGSVTLNPELFTPSSLYYETHNGGFDEERFFLSDAEVDHGSPISFLVSSSQAIGVTEGRVVVGDEHRSLVIDVDRTLSCPIGLVTFKRVEGSYFFRLTFSLRELDETSRASSRIFRNNSTAFGMSIAPLMERTPD